MTGPIIALTTDFGLQDNFVGVMKGVILGVAPTARLVDLVHDLPAHDVEAGAFNLAVAAPWFPAGTIHLAVVDPGVGSDRGILAMQALGQTFIAPDNGLLSFIAEAAGDFRLRRVENPAFRPPHVSATFHGRDIMAPAAGRLAAGADFDDLGPPAVDMERLPPFQAEKQGGRLVGRVIYVDRFGNLITNIPVSALTKSAAAIAVGAHCLTGLSSSYSAAGIGEVVALAGSHGFVEIARNQRPMADPPRLGRGAEVVVEGL